jgi:hypothetical protein
MPRVRFALPFIKALVSPLMMAILGATIALALTLDEEAGPDEQGAPARTGRALLSDDGENSHVTLLFADGALATNLVVHGEGGESIARFLMFRDGAIIFEPTGSDLIVNRDSSRAFHVGLRNGHARVALNPRPDGSTEMDVTGPLGLLTYGVRITEEGDVQPRECVPLSVVQQAPSDRRSASPVPALQSSSVDPRRDPNLALPRKEGGR